MLTVYCPGCKVFFETTELEGYCGCCGLQYHIYKNEDGYTEIYWEEQDL